MSFSFCHFFKHLPYKLSRPLSHQIQNPFPLALLFTNRKPTSVYTNVSSCYTSSAECSATSYLSVRFRCQKHDLDMFTEALLCFGASSTCVNEEDGASDGCESSYEVCVDSIFPECKDVHECISNAANSIGLKEIPKYEVKAGEQCDWIQQYQESFHAVEVTEGVWIVPVQSTPPDIQATNIILNPGLAFGNGEHATTKLCLLLLRRLIKGGELFLDYGTGSGILGIAAIKFGAALSVGVDIDPQAINCARQNAALNNLGPEKMELYLVPDKTFPDFMSGRVDKVVDDCSLQTGGVTEIGKYDVVIANILLNPLLELADCIVSYAKPGAVVGITGILSDQLPQIINRYSQSLEGISVSVMDDWICLSGTRKQANEDC